MLQKLLLAAVVAMLSTGCAGFFVAPVVWPIKSGSGETGKIEGRVTEVRPTAGERTEVIFEGGRSIIFSNNIPVSISDEDVELFYFTRKIDNDDDRYPIYENILDHVRVNGRRYDAVKPRK